jgi:hypothetical protein
MMEHRVFVGLDEEDRGERIQDARYELGVGERRYRVQSHGCGIGVSRLSVDGWGWQEHQHEFLADD